MMFSTPLAVFGTERIGKAYWQVMSELRGDGLTPSLLTALMPSFLDALSDPQRAGRLLADWFQDIDWDWPRWQAFAKRQSYTTVTEVRQTTSEQNLFALLQGASKTELFELGVALDTVIQKSLNKREIIGLLTALPPERFTVWAHQAREQFAQAQLQKVRREMGRFLASRVAHLAQADMHFEQSSDPDTVRIHPYWRFICPDHLLAAPPKRCRDLNQKVMLAEDAMKQFPKLPCERLDCQCRFTSQRGRESETPTPPIE